MNVCKFSNGELKELDQVIKREMRSSNILGKQGSDERLYLKREDGGRGIKSMRDVYQETRLRVAYYMACSTNSWIRAAWRREMMKEENATVTEAVKIMEDVGVRIQFEEGSILIDGEVTEGGWKPAWRSLKEKRKKGLKARRVESYQAKEQQSKNLQWARERMSFVANPKPQSEKDSRHYDDVRADGWDEILETDKRTDGRREIQSLLSTQRNSGTPGSWMPKTS